MINSMTMKRRSLFGAAAGALAMPALMTRPAFAQASAPAAAPAVGTFKLGTFSVSVIRDGTRITEKPQETYGTNQTPEAVADLLQANFLPTDKLLNSFAPTVVSTGTDVVLFDTGLGAAAREAGGGQLLAGLQAAGIAPDQVTIVVLTHMHGDHIGGLMENGSPAFPNARYVTGQAEYDFWSDTARVGTPAENGHKGVLANVVPLAEKITFIGNEGEVVPGINGLAAFGHSPGHMIYRIESEGKALILTADTANHFVLSLQRPDWEVRFDMDKAAAAQTRKSVLDMLATDRLPFVGYHMPFPSAGFIEKLDLGYRFVPETYQFDV